EEQVTNHDEEEPHQQQQQQQQQQHQEKEEEVVVEEEAVAEAQQEVEEAESEASFQNEDVVFVMEVTQKGGLCDYIRIRRGDDPEQLARVSADNCEWSAL